MAIDTKAKRMNMLSVCNPIAWHALFEPDGAVDADDRGVLLHLYAGNAFDSPIAAVDTAVNIAGSPALSIAKKIASEPTDIRQNVP